MRLIRACWALKTMLYYTEVCLSPHEVPNHNSLCIYISGCVNRCVACHYPLLQQPDYGDVLSENYENIVALYSSYATCICFLGEGKNTREEHEEFENMVVYARQQGLKTCLYCGRDTIIESWMEIFDYVKIGSFQKSRGGLDSPTTNQKMLEKTAYEYSDITYKFR